MNSLILKYSPVFQYHSEEKYWPVHLKEYFNSCELYYDDKKVCDVGDGLRLLKTEYNNQCPNNIHNTLDKRRNNNFHLKHLGDKSGSAHPYEVPCYAYISNSITCVDIVYALHFAYSGEISVGKIGTHDLDISHVICRVGIDGELKKVFFSYHNGGHWEFAENLDYVNDHPVVYVARWSHGLYPGPVGKINRYYGLANDKVDDKGSFYNHPVVIVDSDKLNSELLLHYNGRIYKGGQGMVFFRGRSWRDTRYLTGYPDTGAKNVFCCQPKSPYME